MVNVMSQPQELRRMGLRQGGGECQGRALHPKHASRYTQRHRCSLPVCSVLCCSSYMCLDVQGTRGVSAQAEPAWRCRAAGGMPLEPPPAGVAVSAVVPAKHLSGADLLGSRHVCGRAVGAVSADAPRAGMQAECGGLRPGRSNRSACDHMPPRAACCVCCVTKLSTRYTRASGRRFATSCRLYGLSAALAPRLCTGLPM
jgi:hypothetical protein